MNVKEIGGYIELDKYTLPMLHENAIALNLARNCLAYLIEAKGIKKIAIPKLLCDSVGIVCKSAGVKISYYSVGLDFLPVDVEVEKDEWLYLVNYYGQICNEKIETIRKKYEKLIVDNVQAYFQKPVQGIDTIYTCRKFFGVPDGAFLYTDKVIERELEQDFSYDKMMHILGRFEKTASEFYGEYVYGEENFSGAPLKRMSKLTDNLLHAINYNNVAKIRTDNFLILHKAFGRVNKLNLIIPQGAFMYPLYIGNGAKIRKKLQKKKIFIPTLWSDVLMHCKQSELEYDMAQNILPLPLDQRYTLENMKYMINILDDLRDELL